MFDPYRKWLGIQPKERPPNHYRLLGVNLFEDDLDVIEGAADKQMAFVRQYQSGEHGAHAAQILNELAVARLCLLKPAKKKAYDATLRKEMAAAQPDPEEVFADIPLPDVPPASIIELPKRRRKSKKWKLPFKPQTAIRVIVVAAIILAIAVFAPRWSTIPSLENLTLIRAPTTTPPPIVPSPNANSPVIPQTTSVAQIETPIPQNNAVSVPPVSPPARQSTPMAPVPPPLVMRPSSQPPARPAGSRTTTHAPAEVTESELVGGNGGIPSRQELNGKAMIGIDWMPGEWAGTRALAQIFPVSAAGSLHPNCAQVVAPKGYAVGAIKVSAPKYVSSVQLVFMKINEDGSLDTSETKLSKWLGSKPAGEITTLSGEGRRIVGLHFRNALVVDAIGILIEASPDSE